MMRNLKYVLVGFRRLIQSGMWKLRTWEMEKLEEN